MTIDKSKGEFIPWGVLLEREGGKDDPAAVQAAINYCTACHSLGPTWYSYNTMTKRTEYLHLRREHSEIFQTIWGLHSQQSSEGTSASTGSSSGSASSSSASAASAVD
eukprot:14107874-Alexandrium_andersonii.AAC.1